MLVVAEEGEIIELLVAPTHLLLVDQVLVDLVVVQQLEVQVMVEMG
jgi:hypothetical protein